MRLIVGRDYYDSALGLGRDDAITFVRSRDATWTDEAAKAAGFSLPMLGFQFEPTDRRSHAERYYGRHHSASFRRDGSDYVARPIRAWVCGKAWRGIAVSALTSSLRPAAVPPPPDLQFFWDDAVFAEWTEAHGVRPLVRDFLLARERVASPPRLGLHDTPRAVFDRLVADRITVLTYVPPEVRRSFPGALPTGPDSWRVNGDDLKDVQFYRVMDAYAAFQEISMWVGGVLSSIGNPMVQITDDRVKAAKHGFDETSFRRAKGG